MSKLGEAGAESAEQVPFGYLFPAGLTPALYISEDRMRKILEAERRREENHEKSDNDKPPKPPRRPNARIGGIVLNSF